MNFETNTLFFCDALALLERLPSEAVTLAYLEPPWFTGSSLESSTAKSRKLTDEQYTSYLSKVVQQMRRILINEGSLVIRWSIASPLDVRLVVNQAFSEQPKCEITWPRKRIGKFARKALIVDDEFILIYCKAGEPIYNPIFRPLSNEEKSLYHMTDERGPFRLTELTAPFGRSTTQVTWRGYSPPPRSSWRYTLEKLEALALENRIFFPANSGMPRLKNYLDNHSCIEIGTIWEDIPSLVPQHERTGYPVQTPLALMERIVQLLSNEGDLGRVINCWVMRVERCRTDEW